MLILGVAAETTLVLVNIPEWENVFLTMLVPPVISMAISCENIHVPFLLKAQSLNFV